MWLFETILTQQLFLAIAMRRVTSSWEAPWSCLLLMQCSPRTSISASGRSSIKRASVNLFTTVTMRTIKKEQATMCIALLCKPISIPHFLLEIGCSPSISQSPMANSSHPKNRYRLFKLSTTQFRKQAPSDWQSWTKPSPKASAFLQCKPTDSGWLSWQPREPHFPAC